MKKIVVYLLLCFAMPSYALAQNPSLQLGLFPADKSLAESEELIGKQAKVEAKFVGWGENGEFPKGEVEYLLEEKKTLLIFWEGDEGNGKFSFKNVLSGKWNTYIQQFAADAKEYGGPVILVPFPEMNGTWSPWSGLKNGNSTELFKQAWQHIHKLFADVPNVKFGWAVNCTSEPRIEKNAIELYYPGDSFVDLVGVDGFNGNAGYWQSFSELFGPAIQTLKQYNKPIWIFSMACKQDKKKAEWITDALKTQMPKYGIKGFIWFNENKEFDWRLWSDSGSLKAFREALP